MSEYGIDRSPSRTGTLLATVAMVGSVVSLTLSGVPTGLGIGAIGALGVLGSSFVGSRKALDLSVVVVFGGILFAGIGGAGRCTCF